MAGKRRGIHLGRQRGATGRRAQGLFDTPVGQQGRVDAMSKRAKFLDRTL